MKKLSIAFLVLSLFACTPAMAQALEPVSVGELNAPPAVVERFDWCVRTSLDYSPSGCNRNTSEVTNKITNAQAARKELVEQAKALVAAKHMTQEQYNSELARISLQTPTGGQDYVPWTLWAKPGYYVNVTVDDSVLRASRVR